MDWDQGSTESGSGILTAQENEEAEEAHNKLQIDKNKTNELMLLVRSLLINLTCFG